MLATTTSATTTTTVATFIGLGTTMTESLQYYVS
jgi:hypothetical protein